MSEIVRLPSPQKVAEEAARRWLSIAQAAVAERGQFDIALSGGNTPRFLYSLMASEPRAGQAPWAQSYVFWGDERRVPASHPDSDYRMARETLLDHVPVPQDHIFRMPSEGLASGDMLDYERKIRRHFDLGPRDWPRFDLILLGLGKDGHMAGIFPGTRAVSDLSHMVLVYPVPQLQVERITLTTPVLNNARNVVFLVTGDEKAEALAQTLNGPKRPSTYPAQAINPTDGTLTWLLDEAAAAKLESK